MRGTVFVLYVFAAAAVAAEDFPEYEPGGGIDGTLRSVGSDTMGPLLNGWAAAFKKLHPKANIDIEARGSGTAPQPLNEGASDLAPMSREMSAGERAGFEAQHGYLPTQFRVALDAVAVYVHKDNPLDGLTMEQVDGIFSQSRACGGEPVIFWNQLGDDYPANSRIEIVGRNRVSGTFEFFREHALCGGEFRDDYDDKNDSLNVVWEVATNENAIGFAGIGFRTPNVKVLALARTKDGPFVGVNVDDGSIDTRNISDGKYPLARFVHIYVDKEPASELPELADEFMRFVLSERGQEIVTRRWFIPVNARTATEELEKLDAAYQPSWWE
ncbi:MAG: substrate-binding domain-containing protein [Pseudomonadota bacterium]